MAGSATATKRICAHCSASLKQPANPARTAATLCPVCIKARSVRRAAEKYRAALAADGKVLRTCKQCRQTVPAATGTWPMANGSPSGRLCLACHHGRQEQVNERMRRNKPPPTARSTPGAVLASSGLAKQASILGPGADTALRLGAHVLNTQAEQATGELGAAIEDPDSPFHRTALELLATRVLPLATISKAALRLAHDERSGHHAKSDGPARFVVNVKLTYGPDK